MSTAAKIDSRYHEVTVPIAAASAVLGVTAAAQTQSLAAIGNQTQDLSDSSKTEIGAQDNYIDLQNDAAAGGPNLYVAFGKTAAIVAAVDPTATGVNAAGNCYMIPPGATLPGYFLRPGVDLFIGYICGSASAKSGTTTMRIFQTSRFG